MATYITKEGNLSKEEFIQRISQITTATSVTGIVYSQIKCDGTYINGLRETTGAGFAISLDKLYTAYNELTDFTTTSLKPYVDRVQSPSLAILLAIEAVKKNNLIDEVAEKPKVSVKKKKKNNNENNNSNLIKWVIVFIIVAVLIICGKCGGMSERAPIENGQLTEAAHDYAVYCIKQHIDNPSSFEDGSWRSAVWDSNSTDRRYVMMNQFTYKNNFGERVRATVYVYFDVKGNATYYEFQ